MLAMIAVLALAQEPSVQELVDRYFAETDKGKRSSLESKLREKPFAEVEEAIRRGAGGKAAEKTGDVVVRTAKTGKGGREFSYHVYVPRGYDPAKRYRMIVTLHGTKGTGEGQLPVWLEDARRADDLFLVAPTIEGDGWGGTTRGHSHVLTTVDVMLRDWSIDPNQVWLDGISMGGTGAFRVAAYVPHRFAGIMPRVQGPRYDADQPPGQKEPSNVRPRFLENFRNLPVYWIVGVKDDLVPIAWMRIGHEKLKTLGYDAVFREMDGGHEAYVQENGAILEWMSKRARNPYPEEVVYHSAEKEYVRAYWVEVGRHAKGASQTVAYQDFSGKVLEYRNELLQETTVRARIKKDENAIDAKAERAAELVFHLSDRMLDLDRPVVIRVNGTEVHNRKVKRSLSFLLEDAYDRMDRGMIFSAQVKVKVP